MIDYSIKNLEKFESDKQKCLQNQKIPVRPKNSNEGYLLLSFYVNWSVTKKFLIKTLLEMIDSSIKNPEKLEYDKQNCPQNQKLKFGH